MSASTRSGFTLVELMVVIAVIAIIAAIAIPNLMRSRVLANEATAVSAIKAYATAQVTFQVGRQGGDPVNSNAGLTGYSDNFRNLFYGNPKQNRTANLVLISQAMADAFAREPADNAAKTHNVPVEPTKTASSYQGYLFSEPNEMRKNDEDASAFEHNFAILAVPHTGGQSGFNLFWVGQQGTVWMKGVSANANYSISIAEATPATPSASSWWTKN